MRVEEGEKISIELLSFVDMFVNRLIQTIYLEFGKL